MTERTTGLYKLPHFLRDILSEQTYQRWLHRKAIAHIKRDRNRGNLTCKTAAYKKAIHAAVLKSEGRDHYTGEILDWHLVSTYRNDDAQSGRRKYKAGFALLPSVDHVGDGLGDADFVICAWRTNDAKNDLSHDEFVSLCRRVVEFHDRRIVQTMSILEAST
jgi:hypothetical protein